jgi:hypothetical protein
MRQTLTYCKMNIIRQCHYIWGGEAGTCKSINFLKYLQQVLASLYKSINLGKDTALVKNPKVIRQFGMHSSYLKI